MVLSKPPTTFQMIGKNGFISRPWSQWLTELTNALNNTGTKEFVTQVSPEETGIIVYIKGD